MLVQSQKHGTRRVLDLLGCDARRMTQSFAGPVKYRMKDGDIIRMLSSGDVALDDWFIVGGHTLAHPSDIGIYEALLIEDDAATEACLAFLRRRGAREFDSLEDVIQAGLANLQWL